VWRLLKYEAVYLHELTDGFVAKRITDQWMGFYDPERPHSTHGIMTPDEAYKGKSEPMKMAA
jgi:putative transposase